MPHQALPQRGQWFPGYVWTIIGSNFMREKLSKLDMSVSVLQLRLTLASSNLSQADETLLALLTPPCIQKTSHLEKMLGTRVPVAAHQLQPPSALDLLSSQIHPTLLPNQASSMLFVQGRASALFPHLGKEGFFLWVVFLLSPYPLDKEP